MARTLAVFALVLVVSSAPAHDYWLVPDVFTPKPQAEVKVRLHVGESFKPEQEIAYQAKKSIVLQLITSGSAVTDFPGIKEGLKPAFVLTAPRSGSPVLRVDRGWSTITMKPDKFAAYLKEEGFEEAIEARAAAGETGVDGRERYRRFLKTILYVGPDLDETPTKSLGQTLEITPGKNPCSLKAGDELPVKVEFAGKPLAGAKLRAWHREGETLTTVTATTDKDGKASLKLPKSGAWVVRTVHLQRVTDKNPEPAADWESFWAAVTFALP